MFKICPRCRGEFQSWVVSCPECGVALVHESEAPAREAPAELPPPAELACIAQGEPRALREIAERLQAAGLSCRIDVFPPDQPIRPGPKRGGGVGAGFGLYVRPGDEAEARALRTQLVRDTLPEAAGRAVEAGAELAACPACGEALGPAVRACGECGLEFPDAEDSF